MQTLQILLQCNKSIKSMSYKKCRLPGANWQGKAGKAGNGREGKAGKQRQGGKGREGKARKRKIGKNAFYLQCDNFLRHKVTNCVTIC
jgi:hypothetical protein